MAKKATKIKHKTDLNIKSVAIVFRIGTKQAQKLADELSAWLKEQKLKVYSHPNQKVKGATQLNGKNLAGIDLVVVLGGDGTYIEAVRMLKGKKIPILGVNMGSLGFLTNTRVEDLYATLMMTLDNKMEARPRAMLEVKIKRNGKILNKMNALNDVVLERGSRSQLINIAIFSDNYHVSDMKSDGVVISTPTGSTAYNLSAGGPILYPYVEAFAVTPICPHALTNRPAIFPDRMTLAFKLYQGSKADIIVDGQKAGSLTHNDEIIISRCAFDHYVLRKPSHNYFDLLRSKLKFGQRD